MTAFGIRQPMVLPVPAGIVTPPAPPAPAPVQSVDGLQGNVSLSSNYLPLFRPDQAYAAGTLLVSPSGHIVQAKAGGVLAGVYNALNFTLII